MATGENFLYKPYPQHMIEYEVVRAITKPEDHIDRYVELISKLILVSEQIQEVEPQYKGFQRLVFNSIYRCYIYLKDQGHEELAKSFVKPERSRFS